MKLPLKKDGTLIRDAKDNVINIDVIVRLFNMAYHNRECLSCGHEWHDRICSEVIGYGDDKAYCDCLGDK